MRRGGLNVLVGLVALVMVAGACSNSKTSGQGTQTKKPLLIGASLPLTGDFSEPGTAAKQGYEVWQDTVNKSDGLLGRQVKLVIKLELRARGGDTPIWRVEVPGPKIDRDAAADARLEVSVARSHFNELAQDGRMRQWVDAYEHGHVSVSGDPGVVKLLGNVVQRQQARARA